MSVHSGQMLAIVALAILVLGLLVFGGLGSPILSADAGFEVSTSFSLGEVLADFGGPGLIVLVPALVVTLLVRWLQRESGGSVNSKARTFNALAWGARAALALGALAGVVSFLGWLLESRTLLRLTADWGISIALMSLLIGRGIIGTLADSVALSSSDVAERRAFPPVLDLVAIVCVATIPIFLYATTLPLSVER